MKQKQILKYVVMVLVLGNLALIACVFLGAAGPKPEPMPNPNGYDDFVKYADFAKAAPRFLSLAGDYKKWSRENLASFLVSNAEGLKLLETGISKECRVPDDYSPTHFQNVTMPNLGQWKQAAVLFCAEAWQAEQDERTNDAVKFYLEGVRFGEKCGHGGVIIEKLVSIACESLPESGLERLLQSLGPQTCADVARQLETIDSSEDPDAEVLKHENHFADVNGGIREHLLKFVMSKSISATKKKFFDKYHANATHRRRLMLAFATRAYELDKGKPPASAADLVPGYLKKVPQDPATGKELVLNR